MKIHVGTANMHHPRIPHRITDGLLTCPVPGCGMSFARESNLKQHMARHPKGDLAKTPLGARAVLDPALTAAADQSLNNSSTASPAPPDLVPEPAE